MHGVDRAAPIAVHDVQSLNGDDGLGRCLCRRLGLAGDRGEGVLLAQGVQTGHGGEQLAGVLVPGLAEDLAHDGALDDASVAHDGDVVGHISDDGHVVGDEEDRHALVPGQGAQQVEDPRLDGDVERGGGLVGDEDRRVAGHGQGDAGALQLAAGELVGVGAGDALEHFTIGMVSTVGAVGTVLPARTAAQPHSGEQLTHPGVDLGAAEPTRPA